MFSDKSTISFVGARTFRFSISPGEIVYIGHFTGGGFTDKTDDARELLATMPHVSGEMILRTPTWGSTF